MSNGVYGTVVPANITSEDVQIFYNYRQSRNNDTVNGASFKELERSNISQAFCESNLTVDGNVDGLYNLKLPLNIFGKKGFYTVYIAPREIKINIQDVGVLSAYPDIKGIVISSESNLTEEQAKNNGLVGYRIVFLNGNKRESYYRIITSSNKCEAVVQSVNNSNQKSVSYRYNDSGSLIFLTVSPSIAPSFKASSEPFIGNAGQDMLLINTKFSPIMLDIEMCDNDEDTLADYLVGSQLRDLDNGIVTTFGENDEEIVAQFDLYSLKTDNSSNPQYEVKKNRKNNIDFSQTISDK